jgi:phosphoribosyl 1,2-cyclic phosphodiesterase
LIFTSLASSSKANAYILDDGYTKILIECGLPFKELQARLDFKLNDIAACLVTHEHKDHSRSALDVIKSGIPVLASHGTALALNVNDITTVSPKECICIGSFKILPFSTFHDAAEPLGYIIYSIITKEKLLFATDTVNINTLTSSLSYIAVECNFIYDILLKSEHLPEKVKTRIINSHFEVGKLCEYLKKLDLTSCKQIYLLHMSDSYSNEFLMINMIKSCIGAVSVTACKK